MTKIAFLNVYTEMFIAPSEISFKWLQAMG